MGVQHVLPSEEGEFSMRSVTMVNGPWRALDRDGCSVWRLDLGDPGWDVDAEARLLSPDEQVGADRAVPAVRRRRVLVRAGLRHVLGGLLGLRPEAVPIIRSGGRPVVVGSRRQRRYRVSCSASGGLAVLGVAVGMPIGVDVEEIGDETVSEAVAEGWLSAPERAAIERLPRPEQRRALTRAWVHKEAVVKARGVGLRADLARTATPMAGSGRTGPWTVQSISVPEGHLAAVALGGRSPGRAPAPPALHQLTPGQVAR